MSIFNRDERFKDLIESHKEIGSLMGDNMVLISGNFYGIQKFIFERLATKNAAKVLRAKSAYVQLFTDYLARYICKKLNIPDDAIISSNAGRFEILYANDAKTESTIKEIQKKVDDYFIKNFYGLSGVMLSIVTCTKTDFNEGENYRIFRRGIINSVESAKFHKFDLSSNNAPSVMQYDTNLTNNCLCKICNIRKKQDCTEDDLGSDSCEVCKNFISLGQKLSDNLDTKIASKNYGISIDDTIPIELELTPKIQSYVLRDENGEVVDFKELSKSSLGVEALGILKADVDNMGLFLGSEESDIAKSFEKFDSFSKTRDNFFSLYIPTLMKTERYKHTYIVFAGGDDLFLLGAWNEIVELARVIQSEFNTFMQSDELSISFGIAMAKPTTPISYLAEHSERLLYLVRRLNGRVI